MCCHDTTKSHHVLTLSAKATQDVRDQPLRADRTCSCEGVPLPCKQQTTETPHWGLWKMALNQKKGVIGVIPLPDKCNWQLLLVSERPLLERSFSPKCSLLSCRGVSAHDRWPTATIGLKLFLLCFAGGPLVTKTDMRLITSSTMQNIFINWSLVLHKFCSYHSDTFKELLLCSIWLIGSPRRTTVTGGNDSDDVEDHFSITLCKYMYIMSRTLWVVFF